VRGNQVVASSLQKQEPGLTDEQLCRIAQSLQRRRLDDLRYSLRLAPAAPCPLDELNFGDNCISDAGVRALVSALREVGAQLRVLKLHRNRVGAAGAQAVADLIEHAPTPPAEVHLSHNRLGPSDARRLIVAAACRSEYPLGGSAPLWLRMERQRSPLWSGFANPSGSDSKRWRRMTEMIDFAEERIEEIRQMQQPRGRLICMSRFQETCSAHRCNHIHASGPVLHLPYFWQQGQGEGAQAPENHREEMRLDHAVDAVASSRFSSTGASGSVGRRLEASSSTFGIRKHAPEVLFESRCTVVLNKGPHWICVYNSFNSNRYVQVGGYDAHRETRSWQDIVESGRPEHLDAYIARRYSDEMVKSGSSGVGLAHRLDTRTSGCLVRAKTQASFDWLKHQFQTRKVKKTYLCLAHGEVDSWWSPIDAPIGYNAASNEAFIDPAGQWAKTWARCLAQFEREHTYSLCEVSIETGRTHQIRVHFEHIGCPLVGDRKYNPLMISADEVWCSRLFLHAHSIEFEEEGFKHRVQAPLPEDLHDAIRSLEQKWDFTNGGLSDFFGSVPASSWRAMPSSSAGHKDLGALASPTPLPAPERAAAVRASGAAASSGSGGGVDEMEAKLLELILGAMGTQAELPLTSLTRDINIRSRLRALRCGGELGPGEGDETRLAAFVSTNRQAASTFAVDSGVLRLVLPQADVEEAAATEPAEAGHTGHAQLQLMPS